nr:uncharacterized protein LOC111515510 [Leptinotarsa decemlineata]
MKVCFVFVFGATFLIMANAAKINYRKLNEECIQPNALEPISLCMTVKLGLQKENGDIDKEALRTNLGKNTELTADHINEIVNECGDRHGGTAGEAANALSQCIRNKVGARISRQ